MKKSSTFCSWMLSYMLSYISSAEALMQAALLLFFFRPAPIGGSQGPLKLN